MYESASELPDSSASETPESDDEPRTREEDLRHYEKQGITYFRGPPKIPRFTGRPHQLKRWDYYINAAVNTTGGLEILEADNGIYGSKDELLRRVFKDFNIKIVKESKFLTDGEWDTFFCLCEEGVFIFQDSFNNGVMISRDISGLLTFLDNQPAHAEGFLRKAGGPYFIDLDEADYGDIAWVKRDHYVFTSPEKLTLDGIKQNHDLKEWDDLLEFLSSNKSIGTAGLWKICTLDEIAARAAQDEPPVTSEEIASLVAEMFKLTVIPSLKVITYKKEYMMILLEEGVFHLDYLIGVIGGIRIRLCSTSISGMLTKRTKIGRRWSMAEGPWKRSPYFPQNYIQGQVVSQSSYSRGDKATWSEFGNFMSGVLYWELNTSKYWQVLAQDSYGGKGNLAKAFEKFGHNIVRGSKIIQARGEDRTICICTEGVFEIGPQNCTFISKINDAIKHFREPEALEWPAEGSSQSPDSQDIIPNPQGIDKVISTLFQGVQKGLDTWEGVVELWEGFVKEMSTAGWAMVEQNPDNIHDINIYWPARAHKIELIKDTQILQDTSTRSIVLLSNVGVLQFGLHFETLRLISSSIPKALRYFSAPAHKRESEKDWTTMSLHKCSCFPKEKLSISQLVGGFSESSSGPRENCTHCTNLRGYKPG